MTPEIKVRAGGEVEGARARRRVFSEKEGAGVQRTASAVSGAGKWPEIGDDLAFGERSGVNPDVKKRKVNLEGCVRPERSGAVNTTVVEQARGEPETKPQPLKN